jgi:hypothetical protein
MKMKLKSSNNPFIIDLEYMYGVLEEGCNVDSFAYVSVLKSNPKWYHERNTFHNTCT